MRKKRYPTLIILAILGGFILAGGSVFDFKLALNRGAATAVDSFTSSENLQERIIQLEEENANLKALLLRQDLLTEESAVVYSSYPFNSKSELIINKGSDDGIEVGDAVTWGDAVLVGKIKETTSSKSVVTTIFDPGFETAVRIGDQGVNSLMRGGNELLLDLIPTEAELEIGDTIVTAGQDFPYGLSIGLVKEIKDSGSVFKQALIEPAFEVKSLRYVNILN